MEPLNQPARQLPPEVEKKRMRMLALIVLTLLALFVIISCLTANLGGINERI